MFFTFVGFLFLLAITFGPAAYVLFLGHAQSKLGGPFPLGALIVAAIFIGLGCLVVGHAPFHLSIKP